MAATGNSCFWLVDFLKRYGVVKSDRKHPIQEVTNIFNEYRDRPASDQTIKKYCMKQTITSLLYKKAPEVASGIM
jgi:hypothetical protein